MKTNKTVTIPVVFATILIASTAALGAADDRASTSTALFGTIVTNAAALGHTARGHENGIGTVASSAAASVDSQMLGTNHRLLTRIAVLKEASAPEHCDGGASAQPMTSLTIVSSNAQASTSVACCSQALGNRSDMAWQTDVLTRAPSGASAHKTFRFFGEAVISGSRAGENSEWRENDAAPFSRFPSSGSWAGGDASATGEPRGLRLFSWSW